MRYDKFTEKCRVNWSSAYAQLSWKYRQHHERFKRFVDTCCQHLICMECGGEGGEIERICEQGGPWIDCGFCEGTGLMTPHMRGQWLRWKKEEKKRYDT